MVEEIVDEQVELPTFLYAQLLRERTLLHRVARRHSVESSSSIDVVIEPTERRRHWHMVFSGVNADGDDFRVTLCMHRYGFSRWMMEDLRVAINGVENDDFGDTLEAALAAALGGSAGKIGETQGQPAADSRGARSNAVETRRATVIRN